MSKINKLYSIQALTKRHPIALVRVHTPHTHALLLCDVINSIVQRNKQGRKVAGRLRPFESGSEVFSGFRINSLRDRD